VEVRPRPTRHVPRPPVAAAVSAESSDGVVALVTPGWDRVRVQEGAFVMGSTQAEVVAATEACTKEPLGEPDICEKREYANELFEHEVWLSAFDIDRTEVTVERYRTCAGTGVCSTLPYAEGAGRFDAPDLPAVLLSWADAKRFCAWAGGRLPTEAEWERAARGTTGRRYPWGNVYNAFLSNHGRLAWDELDPSDGFLELAPVGSFPDGATPDGIVDLAGNAEEWVADWYAPSYPDASVVNPKGPDGGEERAVRGGGYEHLRPSLRCAARGHAPPDERRTWRGFRCVYPVR
jgi:formylglycine-generating enzyme required for sulfatase activity